MALYRAFSVGRFRCIGASPKISIANFPEQGYVLMIRKDSLKGFCVGCIRDFVETRPLDLNEAENYLTIHRHETLGSSALGLFLGKTPEEECLANLHNRNETRNPDHPAHQPATATHQDNVKT